jgi:hypothetical protein
MVAKYEDEEPCDSEFSISAVLSSNSCNHTNTYAQLSQMDYRDSEIFTG